MGNRLVMVLGMLFVMIGSKMTVGQSYAIVPGENGSGAGSPMPNKPPSFLHEMVMAMIRQIFRDEIAKVLPVMGTVTATSGTNLLVRRDQDAGDILVPHVAGRRWPNGTRVLLIPGERGEYLVVGGVTTAIGVSEGVVGTSDLAETAVTLSKLASDVQARLAAVEALAAQANTTASNASIGATNALVTANNAASAASHAEGTANSALGSAAAAGNLATSALGTANGAQQTANAANTKASNAQTDASNALTRIGTLNSRYNLHTVHPPQQGGLG